MGQARTISLRSHFEFKDLLCFKCSKDAISFVICKIISFSDRCSFKLFDVYKVHTTSFCLSFFRFSWQIMKNVYQSFKMIFFSVHQIVNKFQDINFSVFFFWMFLEKLGQHRTWQPMSYFYMKRNEEEEIKNMQVISSFFFRFISYLKPVNRHHLRIY